MIVNGVIVSKDKNKYQIGMGLKLIKKNFWINKYKGFWIIKCKKIWVRITNSSMEKNNILL